MATLRPVGAPQDFPVGHDPNCAFVLNAGTRRGRQCNCVEWLVWAEDQQRRWDEEEETFDYRMHYDPDFDGV